ncbi:hypothetical protein FOBRF1_003823 [Fusarium oxysporum]
MDENDAKHRRERSRKAAKAGTETHRRAEPALTQAGYCDGISTQSGGDNSVTAPIHGDSQSCGPRIRTGIMGRGASPTRRAGVPCSALSNPLLAPRGTFFFQPNPTTDSCLTTKTMGP